MMKEINWMIVLSVLCSCSQVKKQSASKNQPLLSEQEFIQIYNKEEDRNTSNKVNESELEMAPLKESSLTSILSRYTTGETANIRQESNSLNIKTVLGGKNSTPDTSFITQVHGKDLDRWMSYYKKNIRSLQIHANRGQVYRTLIEEIFEKNGLPKELYYVGLIESGFNMKALSHASAKGPWQFMKPTAKQYGLTINSQVDERVHLVKSTHAAAKYFKNLYNIFGSWELALSAYNAGEYRVINRIMKAQSRDFRDISEKNLLPKETLNYVPKIAAVIKIHAEADKHGLKLPAYIAHPFSGTKSLKIDKPIPLSAVARSLNTSVSEIKKLNPDLKSTSTPYLNGKVFEFYVPGEHYSKVQRAISSIKAVKPKKLPVKKMAKSTPKKKFIKKSKPLVASAKKSQANTSTTHHKVKQGENLFLIARKYKLSINNLKKYNKLSSNTIHKGMKLRVIAPITYKPIVYQVKAGDNLISIAKRLNVSVKEIKKANKLKNARLALKQRLVVPSSKKIVHTVKRGDNLISIAKKYRNTLSFVKSINRIKGQNIFPGQKLVLNKI